MRRIVYSKSATKALGAMPSSFSKLIRAKIKLLADDPLRLANNIVALKGESGLCRLRVGDWRVVYAATPDRVEVEKIAARGSVYD